MSGNIRRHGLLLGACIVFVAALQVLLRYHAGDIGGMDIVPDLPATVTGALQIAPFLAAFVLLITAPTWAALSERIASRQLAPRPVGVFAMVAAALVPGTLIAMLSAAAIALTIHARLGGFPAAPVALAGLGLWVDLTLAALFTMALYRLTRRRRWAISAFLVYSVLVASCSAFGITLYIGYGSTPPLELTSYSTEPLGYQAAWLHRAYWMAVTAGAGFIGAAWLQRRLLAPGLVRALCAGGALSFVLAAVLALQFDLAGRSDQGKPMPAWLVALAAAHLGPPPKLAKYNLDIDFTPHERKAAVLAELVLNIEAPTSEIVLERPMAISAGEAVVDGGDRVGWARERWLRLTLNRTAQPGETVTVRYRGVVEDSAAAHPAIYRNALFLTHLDLLAAALPLDCIDFVKGAPKPVCGDASNNYQLSATATGQIAVSAPSELTAIAPGAASATVLPDGRKRTTFATSGPELTAFLVAVAPFSEWSTRPSDSAPRVRLLLPALADDVLAKDALAAASQSLNILGEAWGGSRDMVTIVAVPDRVTTALSFPGLVAIGERLLTSRDPGSVNLSKVANFVIAHELAHQWWGYRLVPSRGPGWLFVLEAFPQFAGYEILNRRGLLDKASALKLEERRFQALKHGLAGYRTPLRLLSEGHAFAYTRGAKALLQIDGWVDGQLLAIMGEQISRFSAPRRTPVDPQDVLKDLLGRLPDAARKKAEIVLDVPERG